MLSEQLKAELEYEIRSLFPESGMTEQYTPLVMGVVSAVLNKAALLSAANDKNVMHLLTSALDLYLQHETTPKIIWTGPKVGLVELIYALHTEGVFNHGKAQLKDITQFFEHSCGIELGHIPRQFLEIRERKSAPTRFLDSLKQKLLQRMEDVDG